MEATFLVHDEQTVIIRGERFRKYLTAETLKSRTKELGAQISADYKGKKPILIGVLNGAFIFLSDLMRSIDIDCEVDFMKLSSYGANKISSGDVKELKRIDADIKDRHVIVVEDIVDTGLSMDFILSQMSEAGPASLKTATLLHKHEATKVDVPLEYVGFKISNLFVVGYGLDYGQVGRNLADIYILEDQMDQIQ
ncbi:MAG: hypoxanthine phosphoribosyltransferase [Bacteroidetes Order II. Incertae sedis bacterium]|jgi:hypoxanthine phosphoribosyltransferase|nr:hypoxanthine phosphoribosyltransferase [Bacteroidetes Order II. bacterium]MBT4053467.1 hypoxanthine phosphoribosyltransferase [Bacteroidetes Order II. bacterium]MBT5248816.1 hypoxanthine phosphoribosyltransferase [Bacteroidetes Order II. bacterium]MBT6199152.1 hypoxanthine phosphoribosyltransferase [Bacteroidetes Order II. bacterium]MBT6423914.1 hypoxanthine phosphoribosyltransferase [Bacteroidetes Order II. bacterium]